MRGLRKPLGGVVCQELCKISERAVAMAGTEILLNLTLRMTA
jgi:hypothetical protein